MGLLCVYVCVRTHRCVFVSLHVCLERNVASVGLIAKFSGWSDLELIVWGGMKACLLNLLKTHTLTKHNTSLKMKITTIILAKECYPKYLCSDIWH